MSDPQVITAIVGGIVAIAGYLFRSRTVTKRKRNKAKTVKTQLFNNQKTEV